MPRKADTVPAYRKDSRRKAAVVTLYDSQTGKRRNFGLGPYGTPESRERYARMITAWEGSGRRLTFDADQVRTSTPATRTCGASTWTSTRSH